MKTLLGVGRLNWNARERRCDRYGFVRLFDEEGENLSLNGVELEGKKGRLLAEVIETRKSEHIGDLARGIKPSTPDLGEIIELGEGEFVFEHCGEIHEKSEYETDDEAMQKALVGQLLAAFGKLGATVKVKHTEEPPPDPEIYDMVGLKPEDGRKTDWLNPHNLYRAHEQTVRLYFEEN